MQWNVTVGYQLSWENMNRMEFDSWIPTVMGKYEWNGMWQLVSNSIHIFPWQLRCSLFGPPVYYISNPDQACFKLQFVNKTRKQENWGMVRDGEGWGALDQLEFLRFNPWVPNFLVASNQFGYSFQSTQKLGYLKMWMSSRLSTMSN